MNKARIGTLIEGTLRTEDLLQAFAGELERITEGARPGWLQKKLDVAYQLIESGNAEDDGEESEYLVSEFIDHLNEYAPPFCYFGPLEGDGADFGFWPDMDSLNEARYFSTSGRGEDARGNREYEYLLDDNVWVQVNDHGNVTVYEDDHGKPGAEIWSIV